MAQARGVLSSTPSSCWLFHFPLFRSFIEFHLIAFSHPDLFICKDFRNQQQKDQKSQVDFKTVVHLKHFSY